jgi:hypothetical protein
MLRILRIPGGKGSAAIAPVMRLQLLRKRCEEAGGFRGVGACQFDQMTTVRPSSDAER